MTVATIAWATRRRPSVLLTNNAHPSPNLPMLVGRSMSALPEYFRHQLVPLSREHHLPRCRGIWRCFRSWCGRAVM